MVKTIGTVVHRLEAGTSTPVALVRTVSVLNGTPLRRTKNQNYPSRIWILGATIFKICYSNTMKHC